MRSARAQGAGPAQLPDRQGGEPARHRAQGCAVTAAVSSIRWSAREGKSIAGTGMRGLGGSSRSEVAPALQRQIDELKAERAVATDIAGMWSRPHGEEYYRWALKASTTTNLTPDEVHRMGLEQLAELHGRMDPILKSIGYTQGTRRRAHAGAGQGPALQVQRRRQGPRRDHGLHPGTNRARSATAAARAPSTPSSPATWR